MTRPWTSVLAGAVAGTALLLTAAPALADTSARTPAEPPHPRERVVAEVLPAVTYIETRSDAVVRERGTGREIGAVSVTGSCSGVVVSNDGHIATAGHCVHPDDIRNSMARDLAARLEARGVGPRDRLYAFILIRYEFQGRTPGTPIDRTVTAVRADSAGTETRMPARIVDAEPNRRGDVALLDVDGTDLPAATLAPAGELTPGTPVTSVGYPADRDRALDPSTAPSWKDGTVSSVQTRSGIPFVEVSAAMAPGMSGGPAVDGRGRVIGLNSMGLGESGSFNFVAPTSTLRTMLDRHGVRTEPGAVDLAYRAGLDHRITGENADAVAAFRETLRLRPDHGSAQEQLRLAEAAYATDGDVSERRATAWGIAGGAFLLLLLVGTVVTVVVVRRRRRGTGPGAGPMPPMDPPTGPIPPATWPYGPPPQGTYPRAPQPPVVSPFGPAAPTPEVPPSRADTVC
ncbi:trypsin-like peptidase domain-containing protein [Actinomycetospora flava]|uniref:Trypsin-like peptidase domain-containing protein n=1 Tax=Actinomycetospora flava TaxID=3129232 RepID=A0ABU8M527_9PSEU